MPARVIERRAALLRLAMILEGHVKIVRQKTIKNSRIFCMDSMRTVGQYGEMRTGNFGPKLLDLSPRVGAIAVTP